MGAANFVGLPKDLTTARRVISAQRSLRKPFKNLCALRAPRGKGPDIFHEDFLLD